MEKEIWKEAVGYEGKYWISNYGNVKSKSRQLKCVFGRKGYKNICLTINNKSKNWFVHRVVATAFIPNLESKPQVNHKNGIKDDNRVENLEWMTNSENQLHSFRIGLQKVGKGKDNAGSKKVIQQTKDGVFIKLWYSTMDVQRELSYCNTSISSCCIGNSKTAYGYKWKYAND